MKHPRRIREAIDGILLLDKPCGVTSNHALQRARNLLNAQKAGHTGSLDPLATGMLPLCFGSATRFGHYLLEADKQYVADGLLGIKTSTADALGEVIEQAESVDVTREELEAVLEQFRGDILQVPSMFSALKHQGQPLYKLARAGKTVERAARPVTVRALRLDRFEGNTFTLTVTCSKGTYIRNLVEDIGDALGVGAHVTALRRIWTGGFAGSPMLTLEAFEAMTPEARREALLPAEAAVDTFPAIELDTESLKRLQQGQSLSPEHDLAANTLVRLKDAEGNFNGLGVILEDNRLHARRLLPTESPEC